MSGGLFDWVGEVIAEIGSEIAEAFGSDDAAGSNLGEAQATTTSRSQEIGRASYEKGEKFEEDTEEKLAIFGFNAVQVPRNFLYNETFEQYGRPTQVDVTIDDNNDNEVAIIECKSYTSKWNNDEAVDQAKRLVHVANERGIPLIFSTPDGTTDCFGSRVKEVLNETQCFVISPDNIFFADPSDVKENGITLGLPPEIKPHWNSNSSDSGGESSSSDGGGESLLGGFISSFVGFFGSSPDSESSDTSDSNSSYSGDSDGSWFGNLFRDSSDSESSDNSDSNNSDSGDSDNSWFGGLFGDSSDSESNDSSDCSSSDSDSSYSSDSGSSYSSDSGSSDYGDSGGSWDLFGGSSDSESSDSYDCSGSDSDSSYSSDSDSSYSSDSDSSYSSDSDSSYGSDSGNSDSGSGDYGDSGGSDSSSSSSDSWW
ncbi:MAG: hypothetical protein JGK04_23510 [Microcoleus sp. PH2017_39_LGB_O_B]|uniref:hypothetical protein n=1 Tax=unclassified Microcoleus TaxID=2642155 RepID=UPI001DF3F967|nr:MULTISPECIES: hypothetical protein [unclassified Microcoleus]MCC3450407.1 hypothetical protein [Microcoleus sp. PH2017_09_SFU_O_A]MCC3631306.1 hypothetical protein [Microcoleus sp. PH2017_39_LGB_O_B]MCC3643523.1 hypothetical protein [Microcoleus sp. PH2017_33_LGB_O_A]